MMSPPFARRDNSAKSWLSGSGLNDDWELPKAGDKYVNTYMFIMYV